MASGVGFHTTKNACRLGKDACPCLPARARAVAHSAKLVPVQKVAPKGLTVDLSRVGAAVEQRNHGVLLSKPVAVGVAGVCMLLSSLSNGVVVSPS